MRIRPQRRILIWSLQRGSRCGGWSRVREIDLIPASYRRERARALWIKLVGSAVAALLVTTAGARIWLGAAVGDLKSQMASLQAELAMTTQQRARLAALSADRDRYRQQLYVLEGLRSGTTDTDLLRTVGDAMVGDDLWFRAWQFRRAGVTNAEGQAVETGYFVVVPDQPAPSETWRVETHMTIAGQATDHAALSEFVRRLLAEPEIDAARIRRTEVQQYDARNIVDFDLAVVISTHGAH